MPRGIKIGSNKVQVLPSGSYSVRIPAGKVDGKYIKKRFVAESIAQLRDMVEQFQAGQQMAGQETVRAAVNSYIETCIVAGHSPTTISKYKNIVKLAYGCIGQIPIRRLTVPDVQSMINQYAKGRSPKTVQNAYGLIHKVLKVYRPQLDLSPVVLPSKKNEINQDAGVVIPDDEMIKRLLSHCLQHDEKMYRCILIASQTGLRRGELAALTWGDLKDGILTVNKAVVKTHDNMMVTKAPKSGAGCRNIRIPTAVQDILIKAAKQPYMPIIGLTPDAITRRWERISAKLGVPGRFHDLRHYSVSVQVALGVPEYYIMRFHGQSTPGLYRRVYTHMMQPAIDALDAALEQHSNSILGIKKDESQQM